MNIYLIINHQSFQRNVDGDNSCWCGHGTLRPVIVAPSMVRQIRDADLLTVWRRTLEALRTAKTWIIAGYSLPTEDLAIRSILIRAFNARRDKPTIRVVQHTEDQGLKDRYSLLFPGCKFEPTGFEGFLDALG